jgi:REP element-mobilizing transposase RayT
MDWRHIFIKPIYLQMVIESIRFFQEKRHVSTVGYCIMPNHVHWIFKLSDSDRNVVKIIQTFKNFTATQSIRLLISEAKNGESELLNIYRQKDSIKRESSAKLLDFFSTLASKSPNQNHKFWQPDSDLRYLLSDDMLRQKLEYIHLNPIQPQWQLVDDPNAFLFSSCKFYEKSADWNHLRIERLL